MTAILMSSSDQGGFGTPENRRRGPERRRMEDIGIAAGDTSAVPTAAAERPKGWLGRIIEAMTKPIEGNYDNP
jgi:hypothetical protein